MDQVEDYLERASESLQAFADGPAQVAGAALEGSFVRAGQSIERVLVQAAQSGELNFRRMTEALLADLARIAAEAVITQSGLSQIGQSVTVNMSTTGITGAGSSAGAAGAIANLMAAAAARGARYG